MDTSTLVPKVATVTLASAYAGNRNLRTDPKRMTYADAIERFKPEGFHEEHDGKLHSGAGGGMARVAQFILGQTDTRECVPFLINRDNVVF